MSGQIVCRSAGRRRGGAACLVAAALALAAAAARGAVDEAFAIITLPRAPTSRSAAWSGRPWQRCVDVARPVRTVSVTEAPPRAAFVAVVDIDVKAGDEEAFIDATLDNCRKSFREEWCQRFDFLQSTDEPNRFALVEIYRKEKGPVDHKKTRHYKTWAETVKPMMASPRSGSQWDTICPQFATGYAPEAIILESSNARVFDCTHVYVDVKPGSEDEFIEATKENVGKSLMEPDNMRFDFLRSVEDPTKFLLIEIYRNPTAAAEHKETDHYLAWRENVADMMATPRVGKKYKNIFPNVPIGFQASVGSGTGDKNWKR